MAPPMAATAQRKMRNMKGIRHLTLLTAMLVTLMGGQPARAQLSRLKFLNYKITSIVPSGFRSVRGAVEVTLTNDTTAFTMSDIQGLVYRNGKPFVHGVCNDTHVARGTVTVRPAGTVQLCDSVSIWTVMRCMIDFDPDEYSGDLSMVITDAKGHQRTYTKEGVPVGKLLNNKLKKKKKK